MDLVAFNEHEKAAESQRFKRRWVQSTQISHIIGKNARLSEAITSSINNTRSTFHEIFATLRQSNSHTVNELLEGIRLDCENGVNSFSGGLIGGDIICNSNACGDKYRRIDGVCNNLDDKHFGATGIAMRRLDETPAYDDGKLGKFFSGFNPLILGFFAPRQSPVGPRTISNDLHSKTNGPNDGSSPSPTETMKRVTHMTMQFGQFLDHDITLTPQEGQKTS